MLDLWRSCLSFNFFLITSSVALTPVFASVAAKDFSYATNNLIIQQMPNINFGWVNDYFKSLKDDVDPEDLVDFLLSLRMSLVGMGFEPPSISKLCSDLEGWLNQNGYEDSLLILSEINEIAAEKESCTSPSLAVTQYRSTYIPNVLLARHKKKILRIDESIKKALYEGAAKNNVPIRQYLDLVIDQICSGKAGPGNFSKVLKCATRLRNFLDHPSNYRMEKRLGHPDDSKAVGLCELLAGTLLCVIPTPVTITIGGILIADGVANLAESAKELSQENRKKQDALLSPIESSAE